MSEHLKTTRRESGDFLFENAQILSSYPKNLGVWLRENAARFPQKNFLWEKSSQGWQRISYSETLKEVNELSCFFIEKGFSENTPLAILSPNSISMALWQLAAMQIGIPIVPISYSYCVKSKTGSQIRHILLVSQAKALAYIQTEENEKKINSWSFDQEIFPLQRFSSDCRKSGEKKNKKWEEEREKRFAQVNYDSLAKIQFTSGSTKQPKGVMITHGMLTSNQEGVAQMWPFLDNEEVVVDWLPWHHTFGGNIVFNLILKQGGTLYIDDGTPMEPGFSKTIQNLEEISPTIYFGVPLVYSSLSRELKVNACLNHRFFSRLKFIFNAAAALDQKTFDELLFLGKKASGRKIPFFAGWGCTETSPSVTLVSSFVEDARNIGIPMPGVVVKMSKCSLDRYELRVKGPNVTPGYVNNPEETELAFDEEGFYKTGDAGKFIALEKPEKGVFFDGRIGEDFKLASGTWVNSAILRRSIHQRAQPFLRELVLTAPNKPYLGALVFPDVSALRQFFSDLSLLEDSEFLFSSSVVSFFRNVFQAHNQDHKGNSGKFLRFTFLLTPPSLDQNETTDKGYINQQAVLENRSDLVKDLYRSNPSSRVILIEA